MKNTIFSTSRLFTSGVMVSILLWSACSSPRLSQINQPEADRLAMAKTELAADIHTASDEDLLLASASAKADQEVAAAASSRPVVTTQASTREIAEADKTLNTYVAALKKESQSKKSIGKKLAALPAKMALKSAIKKLEKAEKSMDIKKAEKAKAGKAIDPTVRTGIIIAAVGLVLIIVAGIAGPGSGLIYSIGGIALTVGLVIVLLAALDVI